jgi:hypothetical protein
MCVGVKPSKAEVETTDTSAVVIDDNNLEKHRMSGVAKGRPNPGINTNFLEMESRQRVS